jgi:UDP-N-acetylglucosamine--N-acetylmuramyl-(pentapeptide) pyrophosphoryl-undecaprenol N-acetylglucosamine transferase
MPSRDDAGSTAKVHLIASAGGHLDLLRSVAEVFEDRPRLWITASGARHASLQQEGEAVEVLPDLGRDPRKMVDAAQAGIRLALRERPRLVVTSGAGLTLPFCVTARALGARMIFLETMARVISPSKSGRVLSRLADAVLVQWPEMLSVYPAAQLCRPALLEDVGETRSPHPQGTFVAVGTHGQPFNRLLRMVDQAAAAGVLPRPVRAQVGVSTYRPTHFDVQAWVAPEEISDAVARAEIVVSHAGSGIISAALRSGKRPLVLPRKRRRGEHIDDHQEQLVAKLAELGLVVALDGAIGPAELEESWRLPAPSPPAANGDGIDEVLRRELDRITAEIGMRAPAPAAR